MYFVDMADNLSSYNHFDFFQKDYFDTTAVKELSRKSDFKTY